MKMKQEQIFEMKFEPMYPNKIGDKCARCNGNEGIIPISKDNWEDRWICEECDKELFEGV